MTLSCEQIYSTFLGLIDDYKLPQMSIDDSYEYMKDCFRNTFSKPKIRKLFSSISFDENILELTYTLRNSIDEEYDEEFVRGLFANGMVIAWLEPRYQTDLLTAQFFSGKEAKWFAQANHMDQVKQMLDNARKIVDKDYIRDHAYGSFIIKGGIS